MTTNCGTRGLGRDIQTRTGGRVNDASKGNGDMYINGKWGPGQGGDFHACPRGVADATLAP